MKVGLSETPGQPNGRITPECEIWPATSTRPELPVASGRVNAPEISLTKLFLCAGNICLWQGRGPEGKCLVFTGPYATFTRGFWHPWARRISSAISIQAPRVGSDIFSAVNDRSEEHTSELQSPYVI